MNNLYNDLLLSKENTYALEKELFDTYIPQEALMQKAGSDVARIVLSRFSNIKSVAVLAGKGNNGNDGLIAASKLRALGISVTVFGNKSKYWHGDAQALEKFSAQAQQFDLILDAIFGTGFKGTLDNASKQTLKHASNARGKVVAIDLLSGLNPNSGACNKDIRADATITFFSAKICHKIMPAKQHSGNLIIAPLGIPSQLIAKYQNPLIRLNRPALWQDSIKYPEPHDHKYTRGHVTVFTGAMPGAAYLAMLGASSGGAGMISSLGNNTSLRPPHSIALPLKHTQNAPASSAELQRIVQARKIKSIVFGCGGGQIVKQWQNAMSKIQNVHHIWDAETLESPANIPEGTIITPHAGEFSRLFDDTKHKSRLEAARAYIKDFNHILVLKGNDTLITAKTPHGITTIINDNAPNELSVAGSGDLLAGIIAAICAQSNSPSIETRLIASATAVWLHSQAAQAALKLYGHCIPETVAKQLPLVLQNTIGK